MKNLLIILSITGICLGGCTQTEPPADTSGVVHESQAPSTDGEVSGSGAKTPAVDAAESTGE
jgi:hypothetical protein